MSLATCNLQPKTGMVTSTTKLKGIHAFCCRLAAASVTFFLNKTGLEKMIVRLKQVCDETYNSLQFLHADNVTTADLSHRLQL